MKKFILFLFAGIMMLSLVGCDESFYMDEVITEETEPEDEIKLSFMAEFYDNSGGNWLSVEGTSFDIKPNKIKEYSYNSSGSWEYNYALSSVVSIDIDGTNIESCGSTVIFYDTRLEKLPIEIPTDIMLSQGDSMTVVTPGEYDWSDYWTLDWWWYNKELQNNTCGSRLVIIQSQEGDPICMFSGDEVTWDVSRKLPKITEICIDGKMVYIHRANYAIIDTNILN